MSVPVPPVITRFEEGDDHVIADESQLPFAHIKILGSGHSGVVEKVVDVTTGTEFARKKMAIRSKSARAEMERIFRNEISIIRGLQRHHHIIRVFASYMAKREIGLILEPVADEGDLNRFLEHVEEVREANIFDPRLARLLPIIDRAFGCLASGLAFMHKKRIRHKDIKPQNVLIYRGSVLYTDFGYSLNTNQFSHSTTEGQPDSLTRRYAAPEVLANGERNSSSDTFSLGCVYLELLSAISDNPDLTPNMETFSRDLDKIQRCLLSAQLPQRLAFLRSIIMLMTTRDRQSRPKARQVSKEIMRYNELCCPACRTLDETETDTDTSTELLIVTSVSLPESKVTKTVRPPPANTFDASPKSQSPAQSGNPNLSRLSSAFKDAVPVPEWSAEHQRYLISVWHYQDQKYCRRHYVEGK
jgi:serine/threonine protein kinase